jgi:uroporphyrinogen-III synthase
MRVLVTRPEPASARTAAELERRGHEPVLLPFMHSIRQPEALGNPPGPDTAVIAVTSAEAMRVLEALPPETKRPFLALPAFAVGRATARAARGAGFESVAVADGDGKSLAKRLIAECDPAERILYLTGTPRSPDFEAELARAQRLLDVRECYSMVPTPHPDTTLDEKLAPMPEAILVYSSETARRLFELYQGHPDRFDWGSSRFLCLSEKIASVLPQEFQLRAYWPMEPREDLLLLLL